MSASLRKQLALATALAAATWAVLPAALAQTPAPSEAASAASAQPPSKTISALDAPLFYQLLIGEMELRGGQAGTAYEIILDAARRTREAALFRRAVDIALQGRALDQALAATRSWRSALPESQDALRLQVQILVVMGRLADLNEPVARLLQLTPATERPAVIASLPRFLERSSDARAVASLLTDVLKPYAEAPATRAAARMAIARAWFNAKDPDVALALARDVQKLDADAPGPALLALELMAERPAAEDIVKEHLARPAAMTPLRLAYVRVLTGSQRYAEAARELEIATRQQPEEPGPFLTLGVLNIELRQPAQAEAALLRYVELAQAAAVAAPGTAPAGPGATGTADPSALAAEDEGAEGTSRTERGLFQAWLSLAQLAEQRGDFKAAEAWLAKVDDPDRALDVQGRRATMLARQGQVAQAREMIRRVPERSTEDARSKLMAEAGVLREVKRWAEALEVLATANQRFPDDPDLLYEQAMMAEKTDRMAEMETLLRRVIAIRPENAHAYNALGYSLADRGLRLTEARELIKRALELAPGDPFITDSLGWVEFKLGRNEEALKLLRQAYSARPDPEIGAHLGEVLWSMGRKDEARQVWRDARARDGANEVLRETLARLRAEP